MAAGEAGTEVLLFDVKLKRPACVLLQAAYGLNPHGAVMEFDSQAWLVVPTKGMCRIKGTKAQWSKLARIVNEEVRKGVRAA